MMFPNHAYPFLRRALFALEAENAHRLAIRVLSLLPGPAVAGASAAPALRQQVWGLGFPHPVGLAAGFDKNAEAIGGGFAMGFGFLEIGSVTPRAQPGNPRPRLFRLPADRAVINRMGFNNDGANRVASRLMGRRRGQGIVGVNLGKNKETTDAAADYELGVATLGRLADYLVINVSSPNTPGLRALQGKVPLAELVERTRAARDRLDPDAAGRRPPMLLKIAPDLADADRSDIAEVALSHGLDGLIISNTTITRPAGIDARLAMEPGGLSGAPLLQPSTALLADMYRLTGGRVPLVGVGGISCAADAYAKIRAGASLVQLYSALVFAGPGLVARIIGALPGLLAADGFATIGAAVGADHR